MRRYRATCDCGLDKTYNANSHAQRALAEHSCKPVRRSCRTCGWTGQYSSPKKANWAKRIHSCDRRLAKAAAAERGRQRLAAVDRTPKPCLHTRANHQHGSYAAYVLDRCRCRPCAKAHHDYELHRTRQHAYGRWDNYVDATPAREHVQALMAAGITVDPEEGE